MARPNTNALREFNHRLKKLDLEGLAIAVAEDSCPKLTALVQKSFSSGETVYGDSRPSGKEGPVTLVQSGSLRGNLRFTNRGTRRVMARLAGKYTNVNKRFGYLPYVNDTLPYEWSKAIESVFHDHMPEVLGL